MNSKKIDTLYAFAAEEGTQIKQIFAPADTDNLIRFSIAHCTINPGKVSKPHSMKTSEVYYILQGKGIMHMNEEQKPVIKDEAIFIPPNARQFLENNGDVDLIALCIVDPAWVAEDEVLG